MKLSVVAITRNQEWNVARLIESVLEAIAAIDAESEIVLVDSASTDSTVRIAAQFPIVVYALAADQRLTAAAGRYVGFVRTSGEYVLFIDGDIEMAQGWLQNAIDVLDQHPSIAVVGGRRIEMPLTAANGGSRAGNRNIAAVEYGNARHAGGDALYRRSVLEEVGTFNPFIFSDEEPELCIRIRYRGGYRVVRLDRPIGRHYSDPNDRILTLIRRARRNLYLGSGQNLRMLLGSDLFFPYLRERGQGLQAGVWLAVGIAAGLISLLAWSTVWLVAWLLATMTALAIQALRKQSVYAALHSVVKRSVMFIGIVRGFVMRPENADDYPARLLPML